MSCGGGVVAATRGLCVSSSSVYHSSNSCTLSCNLSMAVGICFNVPSSDRISFSLGGGGGGWRVFSISAAWWSAAWWHQLLCFQLSDGNTMSLYFIREGGEGLFGAPQVLSHRLDYFRWQACFCGIC